MPNDESIVSDSEGMEQCQLRHFEKRESSTQQTGEK